jgi:hypothetical protein
MDGTSVGTPSTSASAAAGFDVVVSVRVILSVRFPVGDLKAGDQCYDHGCQIKI